MDHRPRADRAPAAALTVAGDTDATRILLLPGMDGTRHLCRPVVEHLQQRGAEVLACGYPIEGPCDYDAALASATSALDELQRHGPTPTHVIGWSFSGPVALRLANARPEHVASVTMVASFVTPPKPWLLPLGGVLIPPVVGTIRTLRRLPLWLLRPPSDPLRRDKALVWRDVPARTLARRVQAIRRLDAREDLRLVQQPMLYLASSHDLVVPRHNLDRIRALRDDVEVRTIEGDHFALHKNAARGSDAIVEFVRRVAPQ